MWRDDTWDAGARCEDSLLAAPIILDLILVTELFGRIKVSKKYNVGTSTAQAGFIEAA